MPQAHTRTHAATHNSNRKWQQQPAAEAEAGSDGDRERFTDRVCTVVPDRVKREKRESKQVTSRSRSAQVQGNQEQLKL